MTSRLSSDTIAQMAPLLGSLSRLIARGSHISEVQLRTLLRGIDLEAEPAVMHEAKFWMELLQNLREDSSEEMSQVTVEALLLRGVPEASALLAISEITKGRTISKITVNPERLDFGQLVAGQTGMIEFTVEGATGHIITESDQVRVAPTQVGPQRTLISVTVKPMMEGVLWTSLKLMTISGQIVEVPVQAQWVANEIMNTPDATYKANEQWLDRGDYYYRANRFADALSAFEEAIRLDSGDARAYIGRGKALRRLNRYREALEAFERALAIFERANELDSRYATAFYEKGDTLLRLNRSEEALIAFEQAINFAPLYACAYKGKGEALFVINRRNEALTAIERSIQLDLELADAYFLKGELLTHLNRKDAALAAYRQALAAYERSIQLDPDDAHMYYGKGAALFRLERHEESLLINERALQLDSCYTLALHSKSRTLWKLNRNEEALAVCEQTLRLDSDYLNTHNIKGLVLRNLKRYHEALLSHEQALRLMPKDAALHVNKGSELYNLERYEEALAAYEQAIRLDPISALPYGWKGATLYPLKRYEEALTAFEKAIQLNPGEAVYHYNKGNTLSSLNRNQEALAAYERAMKLDSQYTKDYNEMLERVQKSATTTPSSGVQTSASGADRFDRFTERARKVLSLAQEEAQRLQHNYIGTEHLLLGLVREGDGVAAKVLSNLGVQLNKVRSAVEFIIGRGDHIVLGEIGLTPRAKKVIEMSVDEAKRLNHHYIGTEHILLALAREGSGIGAGVLESLGVNLEKVRTQTIQVLNRAG